MRDHSQAVRESDVAKDGKGGTAQSGYLGLEESEKPVGKARRSEREACDGSSALYRAHKPAACEPLSFHSPGLREGQRTYKKNPTTTKKISA